MLRVLFLLFIGGLGCMLVGFEVANFWNVEFIASIVNDLLVILVMNDGSIRWSMQ